MPAVASTGSPLAGIRVVALEQAVAAPLCTRHLADLGADVVKVERSGTGDLARAYDGIVHGESAYFVWLNYGKRSIELDLATEPDRATFEALLERSDVFVHNLGPGALERLGFGWPALHRRWPALIDCAISGYGPGGPRGSQKAFDLLLQGESGLLSITGGPEGPARVGISIADICAGTYALSAILAALFERTTSGQGRQLEIAMLDGLADWLAVPALQARYAAAPLRTGLHHPAISPYGPYAGGDGAAVLISAQTQGQWRRLCEQVLERPDLIDDPRYRTNENRVANRPALDAAIEAALSPLDRNELVSRLEAADVPFGRLNSIEELLDHPQLQARDRWVDVATAGGPATVPRAVLGDVRDRRVPARGEDTAAVLAELPEAKP